MYTCKHFSKFGLFTRFGIILFKYVCVIVTFENNEKLHFFFHLFIYMLVDLRISYFEYNS